MSTRCDASFVPFPSHVAMCIVTTTVYNRQKHPFLCGRQVVDDQAIMVALSYVFMHEGLGLAC